MEVAQDVLDAPALLEEGSNVVTIEEVFAVPENDITEIKSLFVDAFPLRYGDYFYDSLKKGSYAGRPLLTCIARKEGRIVGASCATKESAGGDPPRLLESGTKAYLMTLAVDKLERRRGIATLLMEKILEWAQEDEACKALYLHVIDYNKSAIDFYARQGFFRFSRVEDFYPIDGESHDALIYAMYLNGGKPPPPEPPGLAEIVWDWLATAISSFASLAFGEEEEGEYDADESEKAGDLV